MRTRLIAALLLLTTPAFGVYAVHSKVKRHRRHHTPTWFEYRVFIPSHENLLSQNTMINDLGLPRLHDDKALRAQIEDEELAPITSNKFVRISPKLEAKRRYAKPWVDLFLQELGQEYYAKFGDSIQVNSAIRTERVQMHLLRINHNAAPVHGETASAHLAGVAVDLQRRGLSPAEVHWLQKKLLYFANMKMVIVEEELKQPCFHVVVTGEYPYPPPMPHFEINMPNLFPTENLNGNTVNTATADTSR